MPSVRAHCVLESRRISARLVLRLRRAAELVMGMGLGSARENWVRSAALLVVGKQRQVEI
jgi:hypothetical protein